MAEVSIDGEVTREPLASHHNYRPRGKKLGARWLLAALPQRLPSTPAPRAQTV